MNAILSTKIFTLKIYRYIYIINTKEDTFTLALKRSICQLSNQINTTKHILKHKQVCAHTAIILFPSVHAYHTHKLFIQRVFRFVMYACLCTIIDLNNSKQYTLSYISFKQLKFCICNSLASIITRNAYHMPRTNGTIKLPK